MVAALEPLLSMLDYAQGVRLLGVHAQKLTEQSEGILRLFDDGGDTPQDIEEQWKPASKAVDLIVDRFGAGMIGPVSGMNTRKPGQSPAGPVLDEES